MRRIYLLLPILLLSAFAIKATSAFSAQDATQDIINAETAAQSSYSAIRSAQLAGANTTNPTTLFNQGLNLLQTAESANAARDYNTAVIDARTAAQYFANAQNDALNLKSQADSENHLRSILAVVTTVVSVALVTVGFNLVEKWQHRRWLKKLPQMRIILKEENHEDT